MYQLISTNSSLTIFAVVYIITVTVAIISYKHMRNKYERKVARLNRKIARLSLTEEQKQAETEYAYERFMAYDQPIKYAIKKMPDVLIKDKTPVTKEYSLSVLVFDEILKDGTVETKVESFDLIGEDGRHKLSDFLRPALAKDLKRRDDTNRYFRSMDYILALCDRVYNEIRPVEDYPSYEDDKNAAIGGRHGNEHKRKIKDAYVVIIPLSKYQLECMANLESNRGLDEKCKDDAKLAIEKRKEEVVKETAKQYEAEAAKLDKAFAELDAKFSRFDSQILGHAVRCVCPKNLLPAPKEVEVVDKPEEAKDGNNAVDDIDPYSIEGICRRLKEAGYW